jgi:hypothetical protein
VRLGRTPTTVVGVMPERYAFPMSQSLWVPLRVRALDYPAGQGPALRLFGRLAPGVTLEEAQAELTTWGQRAAADFPRTHRHLRPRVIPYAKSFTLVGGMSVGELLLLIRSSYVFFVMLLVLICGNVALLMFARAATRDAELTVRNALGASRGRLGVRLLVGAFELDRGRPLPFWFHGSLSPSTPRDGGQLPGGGVPLRAHRARPGTSAGRGHVARRVLRASADDRAGAGAAAARRAPSRQADGPRIVRGGAAAVG